VQYLRLVEMPTDAELAAQRRRRAWWIAAARRADPRKPTLIDVALAIGFKAKSASTVSDWENNIGGGPSIEQLHRLAAFYGVPVKTFMEPDPTDQDALDQLRELAIAAVELEQADWEAGEGAAPTDGDEPGALPRTRSA
jgi:transcriptional regulator with XRE-family HTH domain